MQTFSGSPTLDHGVSSRTALMCLMFCGEELLFISTIEADVAQPKFVMPGAPPTSLLFCPLVAAKLKLVLVTAVMTQPPDHAEVVPSSVKVELYLVEVPVVIVTPVR